MRKNRLAPLVAVTLFAVTLTACSAEDSIKSAVGKVEPKVDLQNAAKSMTESEALSMEISLTGSPQTLIDIWAEEESEPLSEDIANKVLGSSISYGYDDGATDDPADDNVQFGVVYDGLDTADFRVVDGTMYLKIDLPGLFEKEPTLNEDGIFDPDELGPQLEMMVPGSEGLVRNEWVSADMQPLLDLAAAEGGGETVDAETIKAVQEEVAQSAKNLIENAEVTRNKDDSDHLIVTSTTQDVVDEFERLEASLGELTDLPTEGLTGDAGELAPEDNVPFVLDIYLEDGKFDALEFNLSQFNPEWTAEEANSDENRLALRVDVTDNEPVEAPTDASWIDLEALLAQYEESMNSQQQYIEEEAARAEESLNS